MTKKVYVGNLSFGATEDQVRDLFSEFGDIQSIAMINDRDTGRFRGFAFVEMEDSAANAAIKALNGNRLEPAIGTDGKPIAMCNPPYQFTLVWNLEEAKR